MQSSTQFLFDKHCSGRALYSINQDTLPVKLWATNLRAFPHAGAESTAIMDKSGNLYFGSHDGCFYSINNSGKHRWMYKIGKKIYSSPIIAKDKLFVSSGDGYLLSFDFNGNLLWAYDICQEYRTFNKRFIKELRNIISTLVEYGFTKTATESLRLWKCYSWASPKVIDNTVYITGYGIGLHAVNCDSGQKIWNMSLGFPNHILAGPSLTTENNLIVLGQKRNIFKISKDGCILWKKQLEVLWNNWSTPSVDPETGYIYFASSHAEKKSMVFCYDINGRKIWSKLNDSAIRGSIAISYDSYVIVLDFNGVVSFLNKSTGKTEFQKKVSNAKRALWTTAAVDPNGMILITTKDSSKDGSILCMNKFGEIKWRLDDVGKSLSIPIIDKQSKIYFGSWSGQYLCFQC